MARQPVNVPASEVLPVNLTPLMQEAVRLYLDPLMPTFGNKAAACRAAGYTGRNPGEALDSSAAREEIERVMAQRAEWGKKIGEYLGDFAWDAARELVSQLSIGRSLEIIDPREVLTREVLNQVEIDPDTNEATIVGRGLSKEEIEQVKQVNKHNMVVIHAAKERREAARLLIAYKIGTPEHRVRVTSEKELPDVFDLSKLDAEQLGQVGAAVRAALEAKRAATRSKAGDGPVLDAEIVG
jgi:hypothetical protein